MKKLLIYIVCAIVVVACGVSIYYIVRNDENIYNTLSTEEAIYLNVGEEIPIPVVHERKHKDTKLDVSASNESILVDTENWTISAVAEGDVSLTVTPSNTNFGPFKFIFKIGNGSVGMPYYIRNEADLKLIGSEKFPLSASYRLSGDITLSEEFTPIGVNLLNEENMSFTGTFDGQGYTIDGLNITTNSSYSEFPTGLFAVVDENARVENVILKNAKVTTFSRFSGIVAGRNYGLIGKVRVVDGEITNVLDTESEQRSSYTGIICGLNETKTSYAEVSLCTVSAKIVGDFVAGGLVGWNNAGIVANNDIKVTSASLQPSYQNDSLSFFGGVAGRSTNKQSETSIVANNIVSINSIEGKSSKFGGIFGVLSTDDLSAVGYYSMLFYNAPVLITPVVMNINEQELSINTQTARNFVKNITSSEKVREETYSKEGSLWDFENIWALSEEVSLAIDYENENLDYQVFTKIGKIFEIYDETTLANAVENMRVNPLAKVTYIIKGSSEYVEEKDENGDPILDENGEPVVNKVQKNYEFTAHGQWQPIGNKETPFLGSIIAEDDATITFSNINSSGDFAGLFGYLTQQSTINNVILSQAELSGTMVGGIVAFNHGAKINNCQVIDVVIETIKYAGAVAGYNTGSITSDFSNAISIKVGSLETNNIYLGGVAGKSIGNISDSVVEGLTIDVSIEGEAATVCLGGVAGFIEGAIVSNSKVTDFEASSYRFLGRTYGGGIVGYGINSNIESCGVTLSYEIKLNTTNIYSLAGGIAAYIENGSVNKSAVGTITLISHSSAGLVSFLDGEIKESYSGEQCTAKGQVVGGMVNHLYGTISDSYAICRLDGDSIEAGFATYLWKDSEIKNCFTYCAYLGSGDGYAETSSNYKARDDLFGKITNSIVVGHNNEQLAKPGITDFFLKKIVSRDANKKIEVQIEFMFITGVFNYLSQDELLSQSGKGDLFDKLEFNSQIWSFEAGSSPTLKDVVNLGEFSFESISSEVENTQE